MIDKYQPDIMWFDSWLDEVPEPIQQEFCAYYLNAARGWGREVVIVRKQDDLPIEFTVLDHEKSRMSGLSERVWMTDDTISTGSWCYTSDLQVKSAGQVIHSLIDTVAKNGIVLLNISPMADGVIPDDQRAVLAELGDWLDQFGAAIYETRPWLTYGEGPTKEPEGGFQDAGEFLRLAYSAADVRYTRSKDGRTIYAILLGWPGAGVEVALKSFAAGEPGADVAVENVTLLGVDRPDRVAPDRRRPHGDDGRRGAGRARHRAQDCRRSAVTTAMSHEQPASYSLRSLIGYFLQLGTWGFGGPVALVGYMHRDLVERRGWICRGRLPRRARAGAARARAAGGAAGHLPGLRPLRRARRHAGRAWRSCCRRF